MRRRQFVAFIDSGASLLATAACVGEKLRSAISEN
jgi:hypothetical protein